jgi:hypothetical protein
MTRTSAGRARPDAGLDLVELVLIDGDNLLHAVRGTRDAGGVAWLLPRLRAWRPADVTIIVVLDGPADRGLGDRRPIAPGISVRHAGARSADDVIVSIVEARPYADRARTVVVTDDARLRDRVRHAGGIGRRVAWLTARMAGAVAPGSTDPHPPGTRQAGASIGPEERERGCATVATRPRSDEEERQSTPRRTARPPTLRQPAVGPRR